jgi:hypothetical protein
LFRHDLLRFSKIGKVAGRATRLGEFSPIGPFGFFGLFEFLATFLHEKRYPRIKKLCIYYQIMGWATFWAISTKTHLSGRPG